MYTRDMAGAKYLSTYVYKSHLFEKGLARCHARQCAQGQRGGGKRTPPTQEAGRVKLVTMAVSWSPLS